MEGWGVGGTVSFVDEGLWVWERMGGGMTGGALLEVGLCVDQQGE
jgi:hypothetical protein